jgi:hypothetical protein
MRLKATPSQKPGAVEAFVQGVGSGPGFKFNLTYKFCESYRHKIAMLHAAYLALFRDFGYEFIFASDTKWIRDLLTADPTPDELPQVITFHVPRDTEQTFDERMIFRSGVAEADGRRCLIVLFPAADPTHTTRCVLLPGLGEQGQQFYREMLSRPEGEKYTLRFNLSAYKPYPRLSDPNGTTYLRKLWRSKF